MKRSLNLLAATCLFIATMSGAASAETDVAGEFDIPFQKFVLDNGLTLIVHEDHKAPIVAVNVWYHVGSKNEQPNKTGFAHLFEHLMFNGSENHNDDYFGPLERVGATSLNGTTNADRTNYFQNVPVSALDLALWMESDRMGHLLGAIQQERLDEQRGVVQNEKRQNENQPYGKVFMTLGENAYPMGHPYSWTTIGSMEHLDAASLDDVKEWFKTYYGASNAVISVAGDVDTEEVHRKVIEYFGDIPAGPPLIHAQTWIAERGEAKRVVMNDRVPQARIIKVWNIPELGNAEADYLDLASSVLALGKTSRLYKRLVYTEQIATDVAAFVWLREIGGLFVMWATAQPGQDLAEVERVMDEELQRFLDKGPTKRELDRVKTQDRAGFIRGIEAIGGFGGKSDILAQSEVYRGSPDAYKIRMNRIASATTKDVETAARRWLHDGVLVVEIHPYPQYRTVESPVDRSTLPESGPPPEVAFPKLQRATLSNGLEVILAERHSVPIVDFNLMLDAGYAADHGKLSGTASLTLNMLDEGTSSRTALEISEGLDELGAELGTGSNLDMSSVSLSALRENLDPSLELFADVVLNPAFSQQDFDRLRQQQLAGIAREKVTPFKIALRVFPKVLYGDGHAYALPFTGSGTEADVEQLTPEALREFHRTWFKPNNATMIVVGDTTLEEIVPKLEALFKRWKPGPLSEKQIDTIAAAEESQVYLIDRPDSIQSMVIAGHIAPPKSNPDEIAIESMNQVLGGSFMSRINMNLREDKNWAYGANSVVYSARGQRPFFVYAQVQTDKTAESLAEIRKEIVEIESTRPPSEDEVQRAKDKKTLTLPGRWETNDAVMGSIGEIVRYGYPDDYWNTYPDSVRALSDADVIAAAKEVLLPEALIWVVVGDRSEIEDGVKALGLGDLHLIDADGNPIGDESGE